MTLEQITKDIEEHGLSQWFSKKGLHSVYEEGEDGYAYYVSTGVRLSDGGILEEYHGLSMNEIQARIS